MALPVQISEEEVVEYLDTAELLPALTTALGEFSRGEECGVRQPVRSSIIVPEANGFYGSMSAHVGSMGALACKLVTAYPDNTTHPSHHAIICLLDPSNGVPLAIMGGEHITGARTAGASAVASKYLAPRNVRTLAILGAGKQGKYHVQALREVFQFDEVRIWSRTFVSAEKFAKENDCIAHRTVKDAVKDADIICTVTFEQTPVLQAEWVKPGAHINAVGAVRTNWQELSSELMNSAVVYADSREACLKESGDVIMSKATIYGEIGEVINGSKEAHRDKVTIFKSVGIAVEDVVAAKLVYDKYIAAQRSS